MDYPLDRIARLVKLSRELDGQLLQLAQIDCQWILEHCGVTNHLIQIAAVAVDHGQQRTQFVDMILRNLHINPGHPVVLI
jgi:hypothetical protein